MSVWVVCVVRAHVYVCMHTHIGALAPSLCVCVCVLACMCVCRRACMCVRVVVRVCVCMRTRIGAVCVCVHARARVGGGGGRDKGVGMGGGGASAVYKLMSVELGRVGWPRQLWQTVRACVDSFITSNRVEQLSWRTGFEMRFGLFDNMTNAPGTYTFSFIRS